MDKNAQTLAISIADAYAFLRNKPRKSEKCENAKRRNEGTRQEYGKDGSYGARQVRE